MATVWLPLENELVLPASDECSHFYLFHFSLSGMGLLSLNAFAIPFLYN